MNNLTQYHQDLPDTIENEDVLDSVVRTDDNLASTISDLADLIERLLIIKNKLIMKGAEYGKTNRG